MPTYFEKLTAAKHASAVKASPTRPPPMRLHVDENTGLVYFVGTKSGWLERHLYTVPLGGGDCSDLAASCQD